MLKTLFTLYISIHTPAKGVTIKPRYRTDGGIISIHTPAKGVTSGKLNKISFMLISIHTPAKGVTDMITSSN